MSALAELYTIPREHLDFRDTIRQIARERIAPRAAEIDERAEYPHDLRQLLSEQDILGLPFEIEHGGTGTGTLMLNMAVEEIAKACASTALILMIQELGTLPDQAVRRRRAQAPPPPALCQRRVDAGVRAVGARGGLRPGRDADASPPRRRRVGDHRHQELDHQPRRRGLLRGVRCHRSRRRPFARDHRVRRRGRPARVQRRQAGAQARDPRLADRPADLRRRPGAAGERDRRGQRGLQGRDGDARSLAARRRRPGARDRAGRHRLRRGLRPGAQAVRQADRLIPGDPVQARRHGDAVRRRRASCSIRPAPRSTGAIPTSASTPPWPSCSARTPR